MFFLLDGVIERYHDIMDNQSGKKLIFNPQICIYRFINYKLFIVVINNFTQSRLAKSFCLITYLSAN